MQPQSGQLGDVVELVRRRHEQPLEDVGQMPDCEFVVEVNSRLPEGACNLLMQRKGCLQKLCVHLLQQRWRGMAQAAVSSKPPAGHAKWLLGEQEAT